jgi:hypothetical protein
MSGIPEATAIILTEAERTELEGLARSSKTEYRLRQRARIVLLAAERRVEFLDFMNDIVAAHADTAIHVILDNLNTHKPRNDRWLKRRGAPAKGDRGHPWPHNLQLSRQRSLKARYRCG